MALDCNTGVNYAESNRVHTPSEWVFAYYSLDLGLLIPEETLNNKSAMEYLVKAGTIFRTPNFIENISNEENSLSTNTNNYLVTSFVNTRTTLNVVKGIKVSECDFQKLGALTGNRVSLFPVGANEKVQYTQVDDGDGTYSAKGSPFLLGVPQALPVKPDSETVVEIPFTLICDNYKVNKTIDVVDIQGIVDLKTAIVTSTSTELVVTLSKGCLSECTSNGLAGLLEADFALKNSSGAIIAYTSFTDNGGGQYTFGYPTLVSGTYTNGFAATTAEVVGSDSIYATNDVTFTI